MKKIVLATAATLALTTSVMALDLVGENESIVIRGGADAQGKDYNSKVGTVAWAGYVEAGRTGRDKDMGYEISIELEEDVKNFEFGSRKTLNLYNHGDAVMYDGKVSKNSTNYGLDFTYNVFFKATQYFKPYIGAGLGVNRRTFEGELSDSATYVEYEPTLNAVVGASGELIVGIGYYVEYKYRFAHNVENQVFAVDVTNGPGLPEFHRFDVEGVNGDQILVGLNYKF